MQVTLTEYSWEKMCFSFLLEIVCLPERIKDKSSHKEAHTEHHKQAITQPLVFGIVGQLGSLWEKKKESGL